MVKRFWEQRVPVKQTIRTRTYRCSECHVVLFSVPLDIPVPEEKMEKTCINGHKVRVPKFDPSQMI